MGKRLWRLRHNTARPDIVGADQPQPIDPLGLGEVGRVGDVAVVHDVSLRIAAWLNQNA